MTTNLRSGRLLGGRGSSSSSSSIGKKSSTDFWDEIDRKKQAAPEIGSKWKKTKVIADNDDDDDSTMQFAIQALNSFNKTSPQKYEMLKLGNVTPVLRPKYVLFHIDFTAKNTAVAAAPEEIFFTELTNAHKKLTVRLCESLGPINSISGDRLNGCYYCRRHNNVWHPKGGGFVRGGDVLYKTVQDICDNNQNNAIPRRKKHLPMPKQVSLSRGPTKEHEYISEQVDDASLYATEALKFYNERSVRMGRHINYKLVKPGFVTRVILPTCLLFHVNFSAKLPDVATAPEEMFFAELTDTNGAFSFKRCHILKPVDFITGDKTGDKTNGCYYCHELNNVCHPIGGGFVRGGDSLYIRGEELE